MYFTTYSKIKGWDLRSNAGSEIGDGGGVRTDGSKGGIYPRSPRSVRPGVARLLIGLECYRIRDDMWTIPHPLVTTQSGVGVVGIEENYSTVLE